MAHDVFISYSTHDKLTADAICSIFETNGIRCWIAPRDILPGMDWGESIIDAINVSRVMVLVLSSSSNTSDQVKREVERAVHKSIVIIPFRIENVQLSKSLEYQLSLTHWMDALTPPLESHIQVLVDEIKPLLLARQTENAPSEQQLVHAKVASEKVVLEKRTDAAKQEAKATKDTPDAIEAYFYELAKEKRISKDILMAVLALLDKDQSQLSVLEQQQYALVNDLFASKFGALDFVRKWDKLAYEIERAEKAAQESGAKEQLEQERLTLQKQTEEQAAWEKTEQEKRERDRLEREKLAQQKKAEEKAAQEKWQREPFKQKSQYDDSEREKSRKESLIALGVFFSILILALIAGFVWYKNLQNNPEANATKPAPEIATTGEKKENFSIEMVDIKGGCFSMGSPANELGRYNNERQHQVCVQDFQIGKYEVTQALWRDVMGNNPAKYKDDNLPVEQISWDDVQLFLTRLNQRSGENYRLLTEAEWEYAARAGTSSTFYTGNCIDTDKANYDGTVEDYTKCGAKTGVRKGQTTAVGSYPANPWGLYDMAGNVWEWLCSEYVENYDGHETQCSVSQTNNQRVLRSGGWAYGAHGLRPSTRWWSARNDHSEYIGFRLAKGDKLGTEAEIIPAATTPATSTIPATSTALWGSLAIDSNQGASYGYSYNYPTAAEADARALKECGSNCYVVKNFNGGCGAYAADQASGGTAWGWGTAPSKEQAQELALKYCSQYGGTKCIVRVWSCNSG